MICIRGRLQPCRKFILDCRFRGGFREIELFRSLLGDEHEIPCVEKRAAVGELDVSAVVH